MFYYRIYGLQICSSRKVSLLNEQTFPVNVDLSVDWQISTPKTPDNALDWKEVHSETLKLYTIISLWEAEYEEVTFTKVTFDLENKRQLNFVIDEKKENLWIYHHEAESVSDLESYLVGPALGFIMRMRGIICLHSSAVEIDGNAIALIGHSTAGKSTMAAGLAEAGAKILADDITVLISKDDEFIVQSGYSKIRLRPIAAEHLTDNSEDLPIVYSNRDSRYVTLNENENFQTNSLSLSAIYVLGDFSDDHENPSIEPINSQHKLTNLLANTYGSYVVMDKLRANEFKTLAEIAKLIPMRKLLYAHKIETLPAQCKLIIKDFREIAAKQKVLTQNA